MAEKGILFIRFLFFSTLYTTKNIEYDIIVYFAASIFRGDGGGVGGVGFHIRPSLHNRS